MKYDVFISYSRKDTEVADRICAALDRQGISYFIDRQGIGGGIEFPAVLAEAILGCRVMLYLASQNSYESKFTNNEITFAFNKKPSGSILPYIIDGSSLPTTQEFIFASVNIRTMDEHPVATVLMQDLCRLLGRTYKIPSESGSKTGASSPVTTVETSLRAKPTTTGSNFDIILSNVGTFKLQVVKAVKESLGLGLKEAKELADFAPSVIASGVDFVTASRVKSNLENCGARVDIKPLQAKMDKGATEQYCVWLREAGPAKLQTVKTVKETCGMSLREAKELTDSAPSVIASGVDFVTASRMKSNLEDRGARVDVKLDQTRAVKGTSEQYCVWLIDAGPAKLQAVKTVKEACGIGLRDAKDLVDKAPSVIKDGLSHMNAQLLKKTLWEIGAKAEVYPSACQKR